MSGINLLDFGNSVGMLEGGGEQVHRLRANSASTYGEVSLSGGKPGGTQGDKERQLESCI